MIYKYKFFLKSGASFDVETNNDLYEAFTDALNESIDDNSLIPIYLNRTHVASIVRDQVAAFVLINQTEDKKDSILLKSIEDIGLSIRTLMILRRHGIKTVGDLVKLSRIDVLQMQNAGRKTLIEIKEALSLIGLELSYYE